MLSLSYIIPFFKIIRGNSFRVMPACAAYGCTQRKYNVGVTFHRFPSKPELRLLWIKAVHRENFIPSKSAVLCSKHFCEEDFDKTSLSCVRLRSDVVPSVFSAFPPHIQDRLARERKPPKDRITLIKQPPVSVCATADVEKDQETRTNYNDITVPSSIELINAKLRIVELENENRHLRQLLGESVAPEITESFRSDVDGYLVKAKLENEKLQKRIDDLEELVRYLKLQASIYKDDFEMERRDSENSNSIISELRKKITLLNEERNNSAPDVCHRAPHQIGHQSRRRRGFDVCDNGQDVPDTGSSTWMDGHTHSDQTDVDLMEYTRTDSEVDCHYRTMCGSGEHIRSSKMLRNRINRTNQCSPGAADGEEVAVCTMSCPNCLKQFPTEDPLQLIDHLEMCNWEDSDF